MKARVLLALVLGAAGGTAQAQNAAAPNSPPAENPEEFSRVRGLFDVDLPQTVEKFQAKVAVHPHFGDFLHRGYIRVPVGVRLGLSDRTEINFEVESYLTHGLKKPHVGYGVDRLSLGAKHQWRDWLKAFADTSTGFNLTQPVSHPPLDLTDGYYHFSPYITFSKPFPQFPRLTPFVTFSTDQMWKSEAGGSFQKNQPHSNSVGASTGFLLDHGQFKYTLVCSYGTNALVGQGAENFFSVSSSVLWDLPPWLKFPPAGSGFRVGVK